MPELPECEAITGVVRRHALGASLTSIEMSRGKYFGWKPMTIPKLPQWRGRMTINDVYRVGKYVIMQSMTHEGHEYIVTHNAMTGYFDWEHEPWTFDYVEGKRTSKDSDVRVKFTFDDRGVTKILRFHDARLFGRMSFAKEHPFVGPELLETQWGFPRPAISLKDFAHGLWHDTRPVKEVLMDQSFLAGIGNIYANEACHLAMVDPRWPACAVPATNVPLLLEALRCAVLHSIPKVNYQWLNVYRRMACGTCKGPVIRCKVGKRATFICERCQCE